MSDTPRTDAVWELFATDTMLEPDVEFSTLARQLERELNESNKIIRQHHLLDEENLMLKERIKRLEEALDTLIYVIGLTPIKGNLAALQEAFDMARAVLKAKEAKL